MWPHYKPTDLQCQCSRGRAGINIFSTWQQKRGKFLRSRLESACPPHPLRRRRFPCRSANSLSKQNNGPKKREWTFLRDVLNFTARFTTLDGRSGLMNKSVPYMHTVRSALGVHVGKGIHEIHTGRPIQINIRDSYANGEPCLDWISSLRLACSLSIQNNASHCEYIYFFWSFGWLSLLSHIHLYFLLANRVRSVFLAVSSRWAMIAKGCTKDENVTFSDLRSPRLHTASRCGSMICQRMLFFHLLLSLVKPWRIFLSCLLWVSSSISPSSRNAIILSPSRGSSTHIVTFHHNMLSFSPRQLWEDAKCKLAFVRHVLVTRTVCNPLCHTKYRIFDAGLGRVWNWLGSGPGWQIDWGAPLSFYGKSWGEFLTHDEWWHIFHLNNLVKI